MSREVWKYTIETILHQNQDIAMPAGARFLHITPQRERICLWFEVDLEEPLETIRSFCVFGTGRLIENGNYIGTVVLGEFVWHVYEV